MNHIFKHGHLLSSWIHFKSNDHLLDPWLSHWKAGCLTSLARRSVLRSIINLWWTWGIFTAGDVPWFASSTNLFSARKQIRSNNQLGVSLKSVLSTSTMNHYSITSARIRNRWSQRSLQRIHLPKLSCTHGKILILKASNRVLFVPRSDCYGFRLVCTYSYPC